MPNLKSLKRKEVYRKSFALSTTDTTQVDVLENFPDGLIHGLEVRVYSAACTGLGAASATFMKIIRGITAGSSLHKDIYSNVLGLDLDLFITALRGKAPERTTPTTGGFSGMWYIPFSWPGTPLNPAYRRKDTALLNLGGKARPYLNMTLGPVGDLGTTISACTVVVEVVAVYEPNPIQGSAADPVGDEPRLMLEVKAAPKVDIATSSAAKLNTGSGRGCIALFIIEKDNTGALVTDIFTTTPTAPSNLDVTYGDQSWLKKVKIAALDRAMADEIGAALPASTHLVIFAAEGKLSESIDVSEGSEFSAEFDNPATTANRVPTFLPIYARPIPSDATYAGQRALIAAGAAK